MDVCNIRTTLVPAPGRFPKYMEAQRFVSKNDGIEKMDRTAIMQIAGNMILYSPNRGKQAQDPHLFVTLPPINPGYISLSARLGRGFALCVRAFAGKRPRNNIRLACGTPLDSGRFRQAP